MVDRVENRTEQTVEDIRSLEGLEAVRVMPGMYVGGTDERALHHLVYEVVDNSIDEIMAGRGDHCWVVIRDNGYISIIDNCGGIPVGVRKGGGINTLTMVLTQLHAGAKFNDGTAKNAYKVSGGLHGVGVSAVNALSSHMVAEVRRDGKLYQQEFSCGKPISEVIEIRDLEPSEGTGTSITFQPDMTIMQTGDFKFNILSQRLREMAYVTRGANLTLIDEREKPLSAEMSFYFEGGIKSFTRYLNRNREAIHPVIGGLKDIPFNEGQKNEGLMTVEFGFQYTEGSSSSTELSFANHINTPDGGTHLTGLKTALTRVINNYARKAGILKEKDQNFSGRDTLEGLTAIVSIKHPAPQFESQTKSKLINPEIAGPVTSVVAEFFTQYMEENPREARRIIDKCMNSMRIRDALEKQRELLTGRKSLLENTTLPGKLADCSERDPSKSELFIVEGDSAGGCTTGDTKVLLASGDIKTMWELAEDWNNGVQHFGYATNEEGDVRIVPLLEPRLTKQSAALVEVILDNGQTVKCTPDHPFRMRDGSYKAAANLQPGDSLMPIKQRISGKDEKLNGYEMVWQNHSQIWTFTHVLADMYNLVTGVYKAQQGNVRHHQDFNKRNNDPRNIVRMESAAHFKLHSSLARNLAQRLWSDPDYREHMRENMVQQWETPEFRERMREVVAQQWANPEFREYMRESGTRQWENPEYKEYMRNKAKLQRQNPVMTEKVVEGFKRWFASLTPEEYQEYCEQMRQYQAEYWDNPENRRLQSERTSAYYEQNPQARETRRQEAVEQWNDESLRAWRAETTRAQWTDEYRANHVEAVKNWWGKNPEHRQKIADGKKTKALLLLNKALSAENVRAQYEELRSGYGKLMRYETLMKLCFDNNEAQMLEAARNINCKVVSVQHLTETSDVYDLTVDVYHNFAIGAGVFIHNSAKQGRDRHFQAILPLRGKILNTERARLNRMLDSNEIKALISALGVGISDDFTLEKLRYNRIIIMTDADVDGAHIRTLLLTFLFRYMQPVIQNGHLYIAQPPIFRLEYKKQVKYYYPEAGVKEDALLARALTNYPEPQKVQVSRYKGLGEMNPEQLWETTLDPARRTLLQVTIDDAAEADSIFTMLMGDEVPPRRKFITTHARDAKLDI